MKRVIIVLVASLALSGCAALQKIEGFISNATASIANPVTPTSLYEAEQATKLVFIGLNTYKATCVQGLIPPSCRGVITQIQVYTIKLPPLLKDVRAFVKNNDQVNAIVAYNTIQQALSDIRNVAAQNNVPISQ